MNTQDGSAELSPPVSARDHWRGAREAAITLVEYGDFQCPSCIQFFPVAEQLLAALAGRLCFVYRHFPLTTMHAHAERAAEAAEAAAAQGKFWEMHHALFARQGNLADSEVVECAVGIGLDLPQFLRDLATHRYRAKVREDFQSGVNSGVHGTPTLFINGRQHRGALDLPFLLASLRSSAAQKERE